MSDAQIAGRRRSRGGTALALAAILAAAFALRSIGFERVFADNETTVFSEGDAWYHAHRAFYSFRHFPHVLWSDACLNHPHGSVIPWAPLYDWLVAGVARLGGDTAVHFERVAAWSSVVPGALVVLPVFALGRLLRGTALGLGAAAIYAALPIAVTYARVGTVDHHAAVALVGAVLLVLYALVLDERVRGRRLAAVFAGLALARPLLLSLWYGALLYLGPGELAVVLAGCFLGRRDVLRGQLWSCVAAAALIAPAVALAPTPIGGPWSSTELSRLHVAVLLAAAAVAGSVLAWERLRPTGSGWLRLARAGAAGALLGLALLALPDARSGLARALAFVGRDDTYVAQVLENLPLFYEQGRLSLVAAERRMGGFLYLIPFVPFVFPWPGRRREPRARALFLCAWTAVLGVLCLQQLRYANDYAPAACVGFALLLARAGDLLARAGVPRRAAAAAALLLGTGLAARALPLYFVPLVQASLQQRGPDGAADRALLSIAGTQLRFARRVEDLTPRSSRCDRAPFLPGAGLMAHPSVSPMLYYVAGRATPAANFGPYTGAEGYRETLRFLATDSEAEALAIAERLHTPYVVTAEEGWRAPLAPVVARLHRDDGSARAGRPHLGRFRLLGEGPRGGLPMSLFFEGRRGSPVAYKLFEIVPGALLEVEAPPGGPVEARLRLRTPTGRVFLFLAEGRGEADGLARLRVPYATAAGARGASRPGRPPGAAAQRTRALGPYLVSGAFGVRRVRVPERAVLEGQAIRVGAPPEAPRPAPTR